MADVDPEIVKANTEAFKKLQAQITGLTRGTMNLGQQMAVGTPTIKSAMSVFKDMPGPLGKLGGLFSKFGGALEDGIETWQKLTTVGAGSTNELDKMIVGAANARMTLESYSKTIMSNAPIFATLGTGVSNGVKVFTQSMETLYKDNKFLAQEMRNLGLTFDDVAEATLYMQQLNALGDQSRRLEGERLAKATAELVTEQDKLAKLTGRSRKQQEEESKKAAIEGEFQDLLAGLDPEDAAKVMQQYQDAQSKGAGQAFKEMMIFGDIVTKQGGMQAVALGKTTDAYRKQAQVLRYATETGGRLGTEFDTLKKQADEGFLTDRRNLKGLSKLGMLGSEYGKVVQGIMKDSYAYAATEKQIQAEMKKNGLSEIEATKKVLKIREEEIKAQQASQKAMANGTAGIVDAGLRGQEALMAMSAGLKGGLSLEMEALNKDFKAAADGMRGMNADQVKQWTIDFMGKVKKVLKVDILDAGQMKAQTDKLRGMRNQEASTLASTIELYQKKLADATAAGDVNEQQKATTMLGTLLTQAAALEKRKPVGGEEGVNNVSNMVINSVGGINFMGAVKLGKFATGTPGAEQWSVGLLSSIAKDFGKGTLVELHGKEVVLNEQQILRIDQAIAAMSSQAMMTSSASSERQGMLNTLRSPAITPENKRQGMLTGDTETNESNKLGKMVATETQDMIKEMIKEMSGPLSSIASDMKTNVNLADKQLRSLKNNTGNLFKGFA